ncbi:MAG: 2-C-methyl-D-erythritol 4-phosphate cytidylyltransferase [Oscillospiraceae bacterium]|nr:2-C-methyl-D-erythritol 4-phosphate cytidylyltransferase [Oscillospiraceae bacterium]
MSTISDNLRKLRRRFCSMVVVAAGSSRRMGKDKLFLPLCGQPVLARTLQALQRCGDVDEIIVVTREEHMEEILHSREEWGVDKLTQVTPGGATRTESALCGVMCANRQAEIICIHDGARPFVTPEVVSDVVRVAVTYHAAAPAVPVKDTIKRAEGGAGVDTPNRDALFAVQTPQVFQADLIKGALTRAVQEGMSFTDDCAAVEAAGACVHLSKGDEENIKLTTPLDMDIAAAIFARRTGGA